MRQKREFHDKVVESKLRHQEEHRLGTSEECGHLGTSQAEHLDQDSDIHVHVSQV